MFAGGKLLAGQMNKYNAQHQRHHGIIAFHFENVDILAQRILVGSRHEAIVSIQNTHGNVVWVSSGESH